MSAASVQTCLWFSGHAEEAARTYAALIPGSEILQVFPNRADPSQAFLVHLSLAGQRYTFLNGGPHYTLTPAASIEVHLDTQAEVDSAGALLKGLLCVGGKGCCEQKCCCDGVARRSIRSHRSGGVMS